MNFGSLIRCKRLCEGKESLGINIVKSKCPKSLDRQSLFLTNKHCEVLVSFSDN